MKKLSGCSSFIDVNAFFGKASTGASEFPLIRDRLDFMDRLGISKALVWNTEARQNQALASNQKMIDEIARTPKARGRIIPALAVSGLMQYERDGIKKLKRQMIDGETRALRFANVFKALSLCQLEPVIRGIAGLKPFIVMRHDESNIQDILEFTAMFPKVPLVLTEVMWGPTMIVFDLMRRRKNILVDNSWLHTNGAVEQVVEHFGAERLLFGTGNKSHGGAAIAQLARADITEPERQLAMHGNLERLLGLKGAAKAAPVPPAKPADSLWGRCLAGKTLGVDIVDAHFHLGPSGGYVLKDHEEHSQVKSALKVMGSLGMQTVIVSGMHALLGEAVAGNDLLEKVLLPHSDRFKGYLGFNPFYADALVKNFDRYFSGPFFLGFKTLCGYWGIKTNDPRFEPMWAYANQHRLPVLYHTWGKDDIIPLRDVVKKYPDAHFLIGHSGGPQNGRREAEPLAQENPNVFLEWCGSFCNAEAWEKTLQKVNPRQVVFGTDAMPHDIYWELGRLLSLDVPDEILVPILGQNMRRILALRR
ncbi:MAG: amidohydrolase family protein [Kiritimatiellae bacterium]|nr:amidohydrolase family protein [Kiritimatiellia bacterium]